jgi:hypothetical protein
MGTCDVRGVMLASASRPLPASRVPPSPEVPSANTSAALPTQSQVPFRPFPSSSRRFPRITGPARILGSRCSHLRSSCPPAKVGQRFPPAHGVAPLHHRPTLPPPPSQERSGSAPPRKKNRRCEVRRVPKARAILSRFAHWYQFPESTFRLSFHIRSVPVRYEFTDFLQQLFYLGLL